jgi:hypothetical protein
MSKDAFRSAKSAHAHILGKNAKPRHCHTATGSGRLRHRVRANESAAPAQKFYDLPRDEIVNLQLPPGRPIDEVVAAERFGMPRIPIREALTRLSGDGLTRCRTALP